MSKEAPKFDECEQIYSSLRSAFPEERIYFKARDEQGQVVLVPKTLLFVPQMKLMTQVEVTYGDGQGQERKTSRLVFALIGEIRSACEGRIVVEHETGVGGWYIIRNSFAGESIQ